MQAAPSVARATQLREYCEATLPHVYRYLYSRCNRSVELAQDLTQEVFMAATVEVRRTGEPPPLPWLLGVARHKLADHYRRQARWDRFVRRQRAAGLETEPEVELVAMTSDDVTDALDALPAGQRAALVLHDADGLPVAEVASLLHRSEDATESLVRRGRAAFKRHYVEHRDD